MEIFEKIRQLNALYAPMEEKARQLKRGLERFFPSVRLGYYGGHCRRDENGAYQMDAFPIPVVEVTGICDVEISPEGVSLTAMLRRDAALRYPWEKLADREFEVYGAADCIGDFYLPGMSLEQLRENIQKSGEQEIGVTFAFDFSVDQEPLCRLASLLREDGFYRN